MTIENINGRYVINRDDGSKVVLTCAEASLLVNFCGKEGLRQQIDYILSDEEADGLDISRYDGTRDEFIQEVFETLEDEIDCGNSVSEEFIQETIGDLGTSYDLYK